MGELNRLQHLLAVVEHGGFRRAAEVVHLSQPALTKSIQNLEESFGVPLLDRRHRAVVPTPFGEIVIRGARQILAELDRVRREVDLLKGFESGMLMVGCDPYVAKSVMAPALSNLLATYPNLRYDVEVQGWSILRERLLGGQIDLHVGGPPEIYGDEVTTIEFTMPPLAYFCRAGHPLAGKERVLPEEALAFPRIGMEAMPAWTRMYAQVYGFEPDSDEALHFRFAKSNDWETLKTIVRRTDSISGGPREVVQEELDAGVLVELRVDAFELELTAAVAYRRDRVLPPAAEALINEIERITSGPQSSEAEGFPPSRE
jgi:DNA-binding transcriptional LysR family regulator